LQTPNEGAYSGVVSLRIIHIDMVAAELNELQTMVGNVSSAYLQAYTKKKVCIVAGPEFGAIQGHLLTIEYHCMAYVLQAHDGMTDSLILSKTWAYSMQG
jgi:hypothetical protein